MYVRVNGCMNELKDVHEVRTTEVCEVSLTKNLRGKPAATEHPPKENDQTVTSQHVLYYCTYYSVSLTCSVQYILHTVHIIHVPSFPVSHV